MSKSNHERNYRNKSSDNKQSPATSETPIVNFPDHGEYSYKGNELFKGKTVLITEGFSGIGKATAIAFAREGANVVIVHLSNDEIGHSLTTLAWIHKAGVKSKIFKKDLSKAKNCKQVIDETISEFKKIDILIINATYQKELKNIKDITNKQWKKTYATNVDSIFYMVKYASDYIPSGGSIINATSIDVYNPNPNLLAYASSKAAIQHLTACMSKMFLEQGKNIRINAVDLGPVWTPLMASTIIDIGKFAKNTPLGRAAQPAELAPLFIFLASKGALYISGATLSASGGRNTL